MADIHDPGPVPPGDDWTAPAADCPACTASTGALCEDHRRAARLAQIRDRVRSETHPSSAPYTWHAYLRDCLAEVDRLTTALNSSRVDTLLAAAELLRHTDHALAAELLEAQVLLDRIAPGPDLRPDLHARIMAGLAQWQRGESPTVVLAEPDHPGGDTLLLVGARTDPPQDGG